MHARISDHAKLRDKLVAQPMIVTGDASHRIFMSICIVLGHPCISSGSVTQASACVRVK